MKLTEFQKGFQRVIKKGQQVSGNLSVGETMITKKRIRKAIVDNDFSGIPKYIKDIILELQEKYLGLDPFFGQITQEEEKEEALLFTIKTVYKKCKNLEPNSVKFIKSLKMPVSQKTVRQGNVVNDE